MSPHSRLQPVPRRSGWMSPFPLLMIIDQLPPFFASSSSAVGLASAHVFPPTSALVGLCGRLAAPASLLVSAAPLPTINKIKSTNDVGDLPLLPYSSMACNCILWACYGALRHTPSIWMPNGLSFLLALYYIHSFLDSADKSSDHVDRSFGLQIGAVGGIVGAAGLAFHYGCSETVGSAAVLLCMILFASPLSVIQTVVETKSAESIPLPFTIASLLACFCWSVTGFVELHDMNVVLPNFMGLLFASLQLALKCHYRCDDHTISSTSEMDLNIPTFINEMKLQKEKEELAL